MPTLTIRLTESQRDELQRAADLSGETLGGLLKISYFGRGNVATKKRPTADRRELSRIAALLGKYGSNLNQISHHLNSGTIPPTRELIEGIRQAKAGIDEAGILLRSALGARG